MADIVFILFLHLACPPSFDLYLTHHSLFLMKRIMAVRGLGEIPWQALT